MSVIQSFIDSHVNRLCAGLLTTSKLKIDLLNVKKFFYDGIENLSDTSFQALSDDFFRLYCLRNKSFEYSRDEKILYNPEILRMYNGIVFYYYVNEYQFSLQGLKLTTQLFSYLDSYNLDWIEICNLYKSYSDKFLLE